MAIIGRPILFEINTRLDRVKSPRDLDEQVIEEQLALSNGEGQRHGMVYWLTMARLTEAALLCAGHYADTCAFRLAGDLLINPRRICVGVKNSAKVFEKKRHSRLTDQLKANASHRSSESIGRRDVTSTIVAPALLPYLYRQLTISGFFGRSYLASVEHRMTAIADTLGFLAAGGIHSKADLHQRLQAADPNESVFLERHLCRFEATWFYRFGRHIRRIQKGRVTTAHGVGRCETQTDNDCLCILRK